MEEKINLLEEFNPEIELISETIKYSSEEPCNKECSKEYLHYPCDAEPLYMSSIIWKFRAIVDSVEYHIKIDATTYEDYNLYIHDCNGHYCDRLDISKYCETCSGNITIKRPYNIYRKFYKYIQRFDDISEMEIISVKSMNK